MNLPALLLELSTKKTNGFWMYYYIFHLMHQKKIRKQKRIKVVVTSSHEESKEGGLRETRMHA